MASGASSADVRFVSGETVVAVAATSFRLNTCGFFRESGCAAVAGRIMAAAVGCIALRSLSFLAAVARSTVAILLMRFWLLLSLMTGFDITSLPSFLRDFLGGFCKTTGAVLDRIGGNSWPCTGTPPMPFSVWPGLGRLMMGKFLPPRDAEFSKDWGEMSVICSWPSCWVLGLASRGRPAVPVPRLSVGRSGNALSVFMAREVAADGASSGRDGIIMMRLFLQRTTVPIS